MVYVFLADGFEEIEAIAPVDILRRAGADVKIVGIGGKTIESKRGVVVTADILDSEAKTDGLEMIVLPGGMPGASNLEKSKTVQDFINFCSKNNIYIGAICAAPYVLGKAGVLKGIKATCFPGFEKDLEGALISKKSVEFDKNIITAKGAGAALDFALKLVAVLYGSEKAEKIRVEIQAV